MSSAASAPAITVLHVDDDEANRTSLRWVLQAEGFVVREAGTGAQALQLARTRPDVVLLDVRLPDMSGFDVCRRIRADPATANIPILELSGHHISSWERAQGLEMGADAYLTKPVDPRELLANIRALVRAHRAEQEARAAAVELEARVRQQAKVAELGQLALTGVNMAALVREAVRSVAKVLDVECCHVLEKLPGDKELLLREGVGWLPNSVGRVRVGTGLNSQAGYTLLAQEPVLVRDIHTETRFQSPVELLQPGIVSGATVIIPGIGKPYGVLGAHSTRPHAFSQADVGFLQSVANLLAAALQRSQSEEQRKRTEDQLRQAHKMEAVGRLAGGIAHDFNNLLTVITGYSDLLLADLPRDHFAHQPILEMRKSSDRAAALTRQLLAFSRRQILQPVVLDLNAVVTDLEKMLRRLIGEDIDLVTYLDPTLCRVKADSGEIEQVVMNLVINARDAMPKGGRITIETSNRELDEAYVGSHVEARPGSYALLAVSDTGSGMTPDIKARIFEPFFTTKEVGKGTGLGLATVHGIVKQSGGHLEVYSEVGRGTVFKIYLPRHGEPVATPARAEAAEPLAPHGTETVLLAEDELTLNGMARLILESKGYTVLSADDGAEALELGRRHQGSIDLLLTDVVMPQMSGRELAEQLAALRPGLKVLYMSGYTDEAVVRHGALETGAAFLQKPFAPAVLARKVREVLDRPR
jgi:signal transduction histidine kinase